MPRVVIVSGIQLCSNPRVVKEARALADAGYEVEVLSALLEPQRVDDERALYDGQPWKYTPVIDSRRTDFSARMAWTWQRARTRIGRTAYRKLGLASRYQLGYAAPELLHHCRKDPADLVIVHQEQGLWVGAKLLRDGVRVGLDIEDWHSRDQLPEDCRYRPVAQMGRWEHELLTKCAHATTTSRPLAQALASEYQRPTPAVVYNSFPWQERDVLDGRVIDRRHAPLPSLHWYSQTIGPGRGLEQLFDALTHVELPLEVHVRGRFRAGYREVLEAGIAERGLSRIYFHEPVPHAELLSRISEHDIGFAGELSFCENRDLTISNKILQFLMAGLVVVASDTSGQREVADATPASVFLYEQDDPCSLARTLNTLLEDPARLATGREAALEAASGRFSWESSAERLVDSVRAALATAV